VRAKHHDVAICAIGAACEIIDNKAEINDALPDAAGDFSLAGNKVQVRVLVEGMYPLSEALVAFEHAAQPRVRKILLRPD
jgi:hypothetical protein